jgi:imidazolonepropionase-like amidohydrolase
VSTRSGRILLRNANVLTCAGDPYERPVDGDILIEGNVITHVQVGRLDLDPTEVHVVDLHGATVLPGLSDAHTHISWPLDFVFDHDGVAASDPQRHILDVAAVSRTFLESGYTLIIGAGVLQRMDDVLIKDFVDRGLIPGPRIVPSGAMVTEAGALGADGGLMDVASDAEDMRRIVGSQCDTGVRAVKLFISGDGIMPEFPSEDTYMNDGMLSAAVDEAAKYDAIVTVHARSSESVAMAARTGVQLIHHACFVDDNAMSALEARRDSVWVCPGMHYLYAMVEGHSEPWGMTPERLERSGYQHELEALVDSIGKVRAAGVRILAGGDFGHQWTHHGTYAAELQRYVELLGMTPVEAIHTATVNTGPLVELRTGQVGDGYLADLLIVDGDVSEDVSLLLDPDRRRAVIKDGEFAYINPRLLS